MPQPTTALVLLNMGGPASLDEVEPFLYRLFADRELIRLPLPALLQPALARVIAHFRAKTVRENYRLMGGKSPLLQFTRAQAEQTAAALGRHWRGYVAMRYTSPRAAEVVKQLRRDKIATAVILSMYPHYTAATTGSSINDFNRAVAAHYPELACTFIEHWHDHPEYLDALAARVQDGIESVPASERQRLRIIFSAHALPQKCIDNGDPYLDHVRATVAGVMERLGEHDHQLGFQSRSGPVRWMSPDTLDLIAAAGDERRALLLVPVSFVSDHIETLVEIDHEFAAHADSHGVTWFGRCAALNAKDDFIVALKNLVLRYTD